jgi:hypothetical protein
VSGRRLKPRLDEYSRTAPGIWFVEPKGVEICVAFMEEPTWNLYR